MSDNGLDAELAHAIFMQWVFVWMLLAGFGLAVVATALRYLALAKRQPLPAPPREEKK